MEITVSMPRYLAILWWIGEAFTRIDGDKVLARVMVRLEITD